MNSKNKMIDLLDQIIGHEEFKDKENRKKAAEKLDFDNASGESFTLYHLRILKDLIEND